MWSTKQLKLSKMKSERTKFIFLFIVTFTCRLTSSTFALENDGTHQHKTGYACEGSTLTISCNDTNHINLIRANFGRFTISLCNQHGNLEWSVNCMSHGSFAAIQVNCNRKSKCVLPASSAFFGDPCPGTYKYLEVHYECVPKVPRRLSEHLKDQNKTIIKSKNPSPPPIIIPTISPYKVIVPEPSLTGLVKNPENKPFPLPSSAPSSPVLPSISKNEEKFDDKTIYVPHPYPRFTTSNPRTSTNDDLIVENDNNNFDSKSFDGNFRESQAVKYLPNLSPEVLKINYCQPVHSRGLRWNYTEAGSMAIQTCPGGSQGKARWACVRVGSLPQWAPSKPDFSDCHSFWMINLEDRLERGDALVGFGNELAEMTRAKILYGGDVYRATEVINRTVLQMELALEDFPDERQRNQIVKELLISIQDTISNLLRDIHTESWIELKPKSRKEAANRLMYALEKISLVLGNTKRDASDYIRAYDNIYIALHTRHFRDFEKYQENISLPLLSDSEDSEFSIDNNFYPHFSGNSIQISSDTILNSGIQNGLIKIFLVMYKRLDIILDPPLIRENPPTFVDNVTTMLNSDIIGITVQMNPTGFMERYRIKTLFTDDTRILVVFKHLLNQNVTNPQCVYWHPTLLNWSRDGCLTKSSNETHTVCEYYNFGYFALTMDMKESPYYPLMSSSFEDYLNSEANIKLLLVLGTIIVLILLLIAIVTLLLVDSIHTKESSAIHKNVLFNLFLADLILLSISGISSSRDVTYYACGFVGSLTAFFHYFLLVYSVWILFDICELNLRLTRKQLSPSSITKSLDRTLIRKSFYFSSYLIPFIIILLICWSTSSSSSPLPFNLCLLESRSLLASFVIASSIIIGLMSTLLLSMTYSKISLSSRQYPPNNAVVNNDKYQLNFIINRKLKLSLIIRFTLTIITTLNSTLGVVYLAYRVSTVGYLFAFTNLALGFYIFIYYCLSKEKIREKYWYIFQQTKRVPKCLKRNKSQYLGNSNFNGILTSSGQGVKESPGLASSIPIINQEPIINTSSNINPLSSVNREFGSKYLLTGNDTETSSDYGCKRLQTNHHLYNLYNVKQPCNPYSCHHMIEHVYECIDEEPYVAKILLTNPSSSANYRLYPHPLHHLHHHHHHHHLPYNNLDLNKERNQQQNVLISNSRSLMRCLVPTSSGNKRMTNTLNPALPAIVSDNNGRKLNTMSQNNGPNDSLTQHHPQQVLAVLGANSRVVTSCASYDQGIDI